MEKLSVAEAAIKLGISKEAIYNRIRRNTIQSEEIDGVRYVTLKKDSPKKSTKESSSKNSENKEFIEYLKNEIEYLKLKNKSLQDDKDKLFKEKEEILISSKNEIKSIYKDRDEKLKYFLSLLETPLLARTDTIEAKAIDVKKDDKKWISLKDFLDTLDIKKKERKSIKKLIIREAYDHKDIKIEAGMIFVDKNFDLNSLERNNAENE